MARGKCSTLLPAIMSSGRSTARQITEKEQIRLSVSSTARRIQSKEQNSSVCRQPVRVDGSERRLTARQISEKEQNPSVCRQPVGSPPKPQKSHSVVGGRRIGVSSFAT
jgi:hypothetical protein